MVSFICSGDFGRIWVRGGIHVLFVGQIDTGLIRVHFQVFVAFRT